MFIIFKFDYFWLYWRSCFWDIGREKNVSIEVLFENFKMLVMFFVYWRGVVINYFELGGIELRFINKINNSIYGSRVNNEV